MATTISSIEFMDSMKDSSKHFVINTPSHQQWFIGRWEADGDKPVFKTIQNSGGFRKEDFETYECISSINFNEEQIRKLITSEGVTIKPSTRSKYQYWANTKEECYGYFAYLESLGYYDE